MRIVVLGTGVSGLASAYFLWKNGFRNILLIKNPLSASVLSPWNIMVKKEIDKIMLKAGISNDKIKLNLFKKNFPIIFNFFDELGIKYRESNIGIVPIGDKPGISVTNKILSFLENKIKITEDVITALKYKDNKIFSLIGNKEYNADVFILNIGGFGNLYKYSTYSLPPYAIHPSLFKIGIKYKNLAFNMFHPFLIIDDRLPKTLISGILLSRLRFINEKGQEFLSEEIKYALENNDYHHLFHKMIIEFYKESKRNKIYAEIKEDIKDLLNSEFGWVIKLLINKKIKKFRIHPAFHYSLGGILTNEFNKTNFENVYAIGGAATGLHGINRVGGTAIAEGIIFSYILSENLEEYDIKNENNANFIKIPKIKEEHKNFFWNYLGIIKNKSFLEDFIKNYNYNDLIYEFAREMALESLKERNKGLNVLE